MKPCPSWRCTLLVAPSRKVHCGAEAAMHAACLRLSIAIRSRLSKSSCCCLTSIAVTPTGASLTVFSVSQKDVAVATEKRAVATEKKRNVPRQHAGLQAVSLSDRHALLPATRW